MLKLDPHVAVAYNLDANGKWRNVRYRNVTPPKQPPWQNPYQAQREMVRTHEDGGFIGYPENFALRQKSTNSREMTTQPMLILPLPFNGRSISGAGGRLF